MAVTFFTLLSLWRIRRVSRLAPFMYSPSLAEFLKLASKGNLIRWTRRLLADMETPLSAYRKIRSQGESFLFESVEGGEHIGDTLVGRNPRGLSANGRVG